MRSQPTGLRFRLSMCLAAALLALCLLPAPLPAAVIQRVSVSSTGEQADAFGAWWSVAISPDGVYVAFISMASNLVPGDTDDAPDVFVRDRRTNTTELASVDPAFWNVIADWGCTPAINDRYVVFSAPAPGALPEGSGPIRVFLRDRAAGTTELVSVSTTGDLPNGSVRGQGLSVSADGRFVLFTSFASNLVPDDTNANGEYYGGDVFVRDRLLGTTERVSVSTGGGQLYGNSWAERMTPDGRYVLFEHGHAQFLRDRTLGTTESVSLTADGETADGDSWGEAMSPDGRFIVFCSEAPNLGATHLQPGIFLRDRLLAVTERIDVTSAGEVPESDHYFGGDLWAGVSADGRYVAFTTGLSGLVPGTGGGVFLRDRVAGTTLPVCVAREEEPSERAGGGPMSDDGRHVVVIAASDSLVPGDTNSDVTPDFFVWDRDARFYDVASVFWSFPQIEACVNAGVVQGYQDNTYHPEYVVTRDQIAVYIARAAAGGDARVPTGPATATFEDVPNTGYGESGTDPYWAYRYVEYCVAHHIVRGHDATHYHPLGVVDRGQMAVYIARAKGWVGLDDDMTTAPEVFPDVPAGYWSGTAIQSCRDHGTVQGYADGTYRPDHPVDRGQMAVYVARAFGLP